jgi:hypothetical protein
MSSIEKVCNFFGTCSKSSRRPPVAIHDLSAAIDLAEMMQIGRKIQGPAVKIRGVPTIWKITGRHALARQRGAGASAGQGHQDQNEDEGRQSHGVSPLENIAREI